MADGQATAFLYSGRPDPSWPVPAGVVQRVEALWRTLPPSTETGPVSPPPLGYRGVLLRTDRHDYSAYGGVVARRAGAASELRRDGAREFERALLSTAPAGLLPANVLSMK
jgi:hypothetical protein